MIERGETTASSQRPLALSPTRAPWRNLSLPLVPQFLRLVSFVRAGVFVQARHALPLHVFASPYADPTCRIVPPGPRAPAGWDEERGEESGDAGDASLGVAKEACGHCACACRADDVWAAYGVGSWKHCVRCGAVLLFARGRVEPKEVTMHLTYSAYGKEI